MLAPPEIHREFGDLPADGALIVDPTGREPLISSIAESGGSIVTAGRPLKHREQISGWVDNDLPALTVRVLDHLYEQGYRSPAILTGPRNRSYSADTINAYKRWTARKEIEPMVTAVRGNPTADLAIKAAREMLSGRSRPDSIYASFDVFALGAMRVAAEFGIGVPDELGIVATVDSEALRTASTPLTAAENHPRMIGAEAMRLLVAVIRGEEEPPVKGLIPAELKVRDSTSRNRRA
jgi:DNA-binding LacI/PurR family transcriptional regulator